MSVQSLNNGTLQLRELNISNEYLKGTPGYLEQNNALTTNNAGDLLVNGVTIGNGGGGTDVFEQIYIGTNNTTVKLSCFENNLLDVPNIYTTSVRLYDETSQNYTYLTCVEPNVLDVQNINLKNGTGIKFPDGTEQTTAYLGGGGGGISGVTAGIGITASNNDGIVTISNTGVLGITAGTNISISDTDGVVTINSTNNSGVTSLTAGDGISLSATTGAVKISSSTLGLTQVVKINQISVTGYAPVKVPLYFIDQTLNSVNIPSAGTYLCQWSINIDSYNASGVSTAGLGEGFVLLDCFETHTAEIDRQYFSLVNSPQTYLLIKGSSVFTTTAGGYVTAAVYMYSFSGTATQITLKQDSFQPTILIYKIA